MEEKNMLDYFVGGVPASGIFQMNYDSIIEIIDNNVVSDEGNTIFELCFIGFVAYFEAFSKSHFASLINIFPFLLESFTDKRGDVKVNVNDIFLIRHDIENQLGFLVAEQFDFGRAKNINTLY
jgi:hypothetical protein